MLSFTSQRKPDSRTNIAFESVQLFHDPARLHTVFSLFTFFLPPKLIFHSALPHNIFHAFVLHASVCLLHHCCTSPCFLAYKWFYAELKGNIPLQYLVWVFYPMALIIFASLFCHLLAPQAIGVYSQLFPSLYFCFCTPSAFTLLYTTR